MVEVEEITDEEMVSTDAGSSSDGTSSKADELRLDADSIEEAATKLERLSARGHLEALVKKIRLDAAACEQDHVKQQKDEANHAKSMEISSPPVAFAANTTKSPPPQLTSSAQYTPIDRFALDLGSYDSPSLTLYISLSSVGSLPREKINCDFTAVSFDLTVKDLEGKSYRLVRDNLDKDIDPEKSKIIIKANKIIVKLAKVKSSEYGGFDSWQNLTSKKSKKEKKEKKSSDPSASIMDLMKDMYDSGDDSMKKMIGETMMKQKNGTLDKDKDPDMGGMGGMGGMGDMNI